MFLVTLKDVAARAGVSIATASRVINGNQNVTEASRERVLKSIQDLGYYSNEVARGLRQEYLKIIAVTLPTIANLFFAEMLQGIDDVTTIAGYSMLFNDTTKNDEVERQCLRNIRSMGIAGSIVFHLDVMDNMLIQLCDANFPCLIIGDTVQETVGKVSFVQYDVKALAQSAFLHLAQFKPNDIWFFSSLFNGSIYLDEALIAQCPAKLHLMLTTDDPKDAERMCRKYDIHGQGHAFVSVNDFQALGILNYLRNRGEPMHLVSFGNTSLAQNLSPQITSVAPSGYQIGVAVAKMILAEIEGQVVDESLSTLLTPVLIPRET
jgi:LacI family transcriptional regulator